MKRAKLLILNDHRQFWQAHQTGNFLKIGLSLICKNKMEDLEVRMDTETLLSIENFDYGNFNAAIKGKKTAEEKYRELASVYNLLRQEGLYHPLTLFIAGTITDAAGNTGTTLMGFFEVTRELSVHLKASRDNPKKLRKLERKILRNEDKITGLAEKIRIFCGLDKLDSNMLVPAHYHLVNGVPYYTSLGVFPVSEEYFKRHQFREQ
ncbi:hypothetical protein HY501_02915 [Candidatus Woesearchaeota archaeon]|nr:hypothetical protein [Candidatus Woesearchaeota archaeon]